MGADDDSWEARMAARNRERQAAKAQTEVEQAQVLNVQQPWLRCALRVLRSLL